MSAKRCDDQCFCQPLYQFSQLLLLLKHKGVGTEEAGGTQESLGFFADGLTLSQPEEQIMPPTLLLVPPDFQTFRHSYLLSCGYKSQLLDPNLYVLAERAGMAASYLHLPSKSHRGIAKIFVQVNSLHQINVKNVIRTQKEFFSYCS